MKYYSSFGYNEFVICLGYKGELIKDYFSSYFYNNSDFTVDIENDNIQIHNKPNEKWKISLIDTGKETLTGARIAKIKKYTDNKRFFLTYGDGVSNKDDECSDTPEGEEVNDEGCSVSQTPGFSFLFSIISSLSSDGRYE